jgi:uncharacterized membrane protein YdjX (TVP38/TMEM64 family)
VLSDRTRAILKILLFVCLIVVGNILVHWFVDRLDFEITPGNEPMVHRFIVVSMIAYAVLMAIPFVPGAEIGLAVLMILGPKIAVLVYLCTLAALSLSFLVGRLVPERILINFLRDLRFHTASRFLARVEGLDSQQRLSLMLDRSPKRLVPLLLRYRYLALMMAVNLPGNIIIGGGGGIALMAGLSRLFSPPVFVVTVVIATAPIPLAWLMLGENFAKWLS